MVDLKQDPLINAVYNGIKKGIDATHDAGCLGSCLILIYSGIDTMAFLNMPKDQINVNRQDFITWVERYIRFSCKEQITGLDLYGARCATLHQYGIDSDLSRAGQCRKILYMNKGIPEIRYDPAKDKGIVVVSIKALKQAFNDGVDKFLVESFSDQARAVIVNDRLKSLLQVFPYPKAKP